MIEFQYFDGCPGAKESMDNLMEVALEMNINDSEIDIVLIPGYFQGKTSPNA